MTEAGIIQIEHESDAERGAFYFEKQGTRLAEMTYTRAAPDLIIVDHTFTHEALRGLGVARKLLDALVAWARQTHTRVMATCPYARGQFDKDASIRDVFAG